jgi:hypothetical protein
VAELEVHERELRKEEEKKKAAEPEMHVVDVAEVEAERQRLLMFAA